MEASARTGGVGEPPTLEVTVRGPLTEHGLAVDDLNLVTRSLQSALQEIALARARREIPELPQAMVRDLRQACRLAVMEVHQGSVVIDFDFATSLVDGPFEVTRVAAITDLVRGVDELNDHSFLPIGWTPEALRPIIRLRPLFRRGVDALELRLARLEPDRRAVIQPGLLPRIATSLRRYEGALSHRREGQLAYDIGAPPPLKRRKPPKFPLFESGRPELADEIDEAFGSRGEER